MTAFSKITASMSFFGGRGGVLREALDRRGKDSTELVVGFRYMRRKEKGRTYHVLDAGMFFRLLRLVVVQHI